MPDVVINIMAIDKKHGVVSLKLQSKKDNKLKNIENGLLEVTVGDKITIEQ